MTIGEKIRELRQEKAMTQKQLGDKCGMADSAIRRYESNRGNPTLDTLKRIAKALDVHVFRLLEDAENINTELFQELYDTLARLIQQGYPSASDFYGDLISGKISIAILRNNFDARLIRAYEKLNQQGRMTAVERVEELTEVAKYQNTREITLTIPDKNDMEPPQEE